MANDIKIRLVSELYPKGFSDAVNGLKKVETAYTKTTNKILADAKGSIPKMTKAYKAILESGMTDAPKMAGEYFQNWANALIYNFTGGDSAKLKAQLQKAIAEITNIGGEDNLAYINMTALNKNLKKLAGVYDESATGVESASRRKQAMFKQEVAVLQQLGLKEEEYNLIMQNTRAQMSALSPSMRNYKSRMASLSEEYKKAKKNLEELHSEQEKSKHSLTGYVGTVVKGMLVHQAVAQAIRAVKTTLQEASKASAEAEQINNKLLTVYEGLGAVAQQTASEIATSIGVANSTAKSALSTVGDLLQGQGMGIAQSLEVASDWVKRFQDIINYKDINESLDTFASNMMAGFLGNTRNLRSVGVVIKDSAVQAELAKRNMDKLTGSELELAKMNIRAEMTFKQLENAMGATTREWDTNLAVNRRLNEAWKEYKENLGETVNSVLKPLKSRWTEILTQINKANKAEKEFIAGAKQINVYDIRNNQDDMKAFKGSLTDAFSAFYHAPNSQYYNALQKGEQNSASQAYIESLKKTMILFNATVEDVKKILEDKLTPAMYAVLKAEETKIQAEIQREKDIQNRASQLITASENFSNFQEKLLGITGVKFDATDVSGLTIRTGSDTGTNFALGEMARYTAENIQSAIKSIAKADISLWGDVISGELNDLDMPKLFEAKMQSVADLFTSVWNEALKDGVIDEDEKKNLEDIKAIYKELNIELEKHNKELERQQNVTKQITSFQDNTDSYITQYNQLGMTDAEKQIDNLKNSFLKFKATTTLTDSELIRVNASYRGQLYWLEMLLNAQEENERKEKAKTAILEAQNKTVSVQRQISQLYMTDTQKELDNLAYELQNQLDTLKLTEDEEKQLTTQYENQATLIRKLARLTEDYNKDLEREQKRKEQLTEMGDRRTDYQTQLNQLKYNKTDAEIEREKLVITLNNAYKNRDQSLYKSTEATIEVFDELQEVIKKVTKAEEKRQARDDIGKKINPFTGTIDVYNQGAKAFGEVFGDADFGGVIGILADILSQTEAFSAVAGIMNDYIVPVFNRILAPMLPMIESIGAILASLVDSFLLPVLVPVLTGAVVALDIISRVVMTISSVVRTIYYAITFQWGKIGDVWSEWAKDQAKQSETTKNALQALMDIGMGIERNTSKDSEAEALLKAYTQMRDQQMITGSEYDALVANLRGVKYDRVSTIGEGTSWFNGSNGTTIIYSGDMRFTIEGTNLSADQIAEAVLRKQQQWAMTKQIHM